MREEAKRWLEQAHEDFDAALANEQIKKYYVCAFFSQQAAEKALKALAIEKLKDLPKTHSLLELGGKLELPESIQFDIEELNPDYTVSRYPDAANGVPARMYNSKKAEAKVLAAKKVLQWVQNQMR